VIESIDRDAYVLLLRLRGDARPLTLVWNSRTRFVEEARLVTAAELRMGAPVAVSYRTPFFGKPFASKIDFECGGASRAMPLTIKPNSRMECGQASDLPARRPVCQASRNKAR